MSGSGRLQSDPLFQGLTRPTMIMGVSYMYFVINAGVNLILFINLQDFMILLMVAPIVHMIGYLICLKEPRAIELLVVKASKGLRCINRGYHRNNNSYDPY
ncbi:MAG: VirB3 family type IV secretion system protein [Rickettsiales bacterium]|jgi:type IV secretion system protein VirB3|nr:VirB3 family type IV secretion system protein [Rickettsiales bacterium]